MKTKQEYKPNPIFTAIVLLMLVFSLIVALIGFN